MLTQQRWKQPWKLKMKAIQENFLSPLKWTRREMVTKRLPNLVVVSTWYNNALAWEALYSVPYKIVSNQINCLYTSFVSFFFSPCTYLGRTGYNGVATSLLRLLSRQQICAGWTFSKLVCTRLLNQRHLEPLSLSRALHPFSAYLAEVSQRNHWSLKSAPYLHISEKRLAQDLHHLTGELEIGYWFRIQIQGCTLTSTKNYTLPKVNVSRVRIS